MPEGRADRTKPTRDLETTAAAVRQVEAGSWLAADTASVRVGRFYTGHYVMAVAQLCLSLMWVGIIWCVIDGQGRHLRD